MVTIGYYHTHTAIVPIVNNNSKPCILLKNELYIIETMKCDCVPVSSELTVAYTFTENSPCGYGYFITGDAHHKIAGNNISHIKDNHVYAQSTFSINKI